MTSFRIFLAAALLPIAACSVSTDDLKPVGPGDCAPGAKPCGYKCVSIVDPASGCGEASCAACAGAQPFCDTTVAVPACKDAAAIVCTGTEVQCDGVGACEDLATDERNCGACGHACDFDSSSHTTRYACVAGFCDLGGIPAGDSARGIAWSQAGQALYWTDTSVGTRGRLMRWRSATGDFSWGNVDLPLAEGAAGPDERLGSPGLTRIAANPLRPELYLTGWQSTGGGDFTIFRWDPSRPVPTLDPVLSETFAGGSGVIHSLAAVGSWVVLDRSDSAQPEITDGTTSWYASTTSATPLFGLAGYGLTAYVVYWGTGGGTLSAIDTAGTETVIRAALPGVPDSFMRVAVYMGGAFPEYAWAAERDGSVWRWVQDGASEPAQLHAVASPQYTEMDVAIDAAGVYWMDRRAGEIWEWRRDGTKLKLARGVTPNGIAIDPAFVYFTDDSGYVRRAPK